MLLTVDIGNTQTAVGLFEGAELKADWRYTTRSVDTVDEIHLGLAGQLQLHGYEIEDVTDAVVASVVPVLTLSWAQAGERITGKKTIVVGPGIKTGLPMRYDNPAEVGADRVADAIAAIHEYGAPAIVVDLGTATNIEVINDRGEFMGGIIAPGLGMGSMVLAQKTARLPEVELMMPSHVVGTNTSDAIRSGLIRGEVARIDGLVNMIFDELGYETPVIATGGYANVIAKLSDTITDHDSILTLKGLQLIYERNK